jgi:hypothetical protein
MKRLVTMLLSAGVAVACGDDSPGDDGSGAEAVTGGETDGAVQSEHDAAGQAGGNGGAAAAAGNGGAAATGGGTGGAAATSDTWASFAQSFFGTYCVQCHGAGNATRDYTLYEQVVRDTNLIRCGVAVEKLDGCGDWPPPSQFPIGGGPYPTNEERSRLVAWLDAGAPQ